jgi:hypothetical protein
MFKTSILALILTACLAVRATAQPITLRAPQVPLRDIAARAAEELHDDLVFDPALALTRVDVNAENQRPEKLMARLAAANDFDAYVIGRALIVGTKVFVAKYRDAVTSILPVEAGHEVAVANQIAATWACADTSVDKQAHEVIIKVPRFVYQNMKVAVSQIDATLPTATATAP